MWQVCDKNVALNLLEVSVVSNVNVQNPNYVSNMCFLLGVGSDWFAIVNNWCSGSMIFLVELGKVVAFCQG